MAFFITILLVGVKIVLLHVTYCNNPFDEFSDEYQVRDRSIVF